jgi:hypothetical protein
MTPASTARTRMKMTNHMVTSEVSCRDVRTPPIHLSTAPSSGPSSVSRIAVSGSPLRDARSCTDLPATRSWAQRAPRTG